jgi:hypothetical protein
MLMTYQMTKALRRALRESNRKKTYHRPIKLLQSAAAAAAAAAGAGVIVAGLDFHPLIRNRRRLRD